MSNVNNLNGIPNFGHGEEPLKEAPLIPTIPEEPTIDEVKLSSETKVKEKKPKKKK